MYDNPSLYTMGRREQSRAKQSSTSMIKQVQHRFSITFLAILILTAFNVCAYVSVALTRKMCKIKKSHKLRENMSGPSLGFDPETPAPVLVSDQEFRDGVSQDYFSAMGAADLQARGYTTTSECHEAYLAARIETGLDDPHVQMLFGLARNADMLCQASISKQKTGALFSSATQDLLAALPSVPWRFVVLQDGIEGGMPHTQGDMVCLPHSFFLNQGPATLKTLIHEKIHVLQRSQMGLWARTLSALGYVAYQKRQDLPQSIKARARSNPDLDGYVYSTKGTCATVYVLRESASSPPSLSGTDAVCVDNSGQPPDDYEHPNELVAYKLSEQVTALV